MKLLKCSGCGKAWDGKSKYIAIWMLGGGSYRLMVGCAHVAPAEIETAEVIYTSATCFGPWIERWSSSLSCDHARVN